MSTFRDPEGAIWGVGAYLLRGYTVAFSPLGFFSTDGISRRHVSVYRKLRAPTAGAHASLHQLDMHNPAPVSCGRGSSRRQWSSLVCGFFPPGFFTTVAASR